MNSKRMYFSFLVLAVYAVLGVVGVYSQSSNSSAEIRMSDIADMAKGVDSGKASSSGGGSSANASLEWHSFLPGSFK